MIAEAVGHVCALGDGSCHAADVDIMDVVAVNRRERGIRIKFVLTVASMPQAQTAAELLGSYLHTTTFQDDLHAAGHNLEEVSGVNVEMEPTASDLGPPKEWEPPSLAPAPPPGGDGSKDALVVALCIVSALFLCGCVVAAVYLTRGDKGGQGDDSVRTHWLMPAPLPCIFLIHLD